jgi:hypothetical protein
VMPHVGPGGMVASVVRCGPPVWPAADHRVNFAAAGRIFPDRLVG